MRLPTEDNPRHLGAVFGSPLVRKPGTRMDISPKSLSGLFRQLGLPDDDKSVEDFVASHNAPPAGGPIWDEPFWSPAQAAFLKEAWEADSDWVEVIDELGALLHGR